MSPEVKTPVLAGARWRIFRDPAGVPHVQGEDVESLAEGHGAITAMDRVWHLEVLRSRAEARSAALLGDDHLDADHLTAALRVEETAKRWWAAAPAADRGFLAAYARGVNQVLARAWQESAEARRLGLVESVPPSWQPWTPVAVHLDAHLLTGSLPEQLWRRRVQESLGEHWLQVLDAEPPRSAASNAWLVPGAFSATGSPLIAADPHRIVEESGPYQPVCFSAPGLRVRGLALVGLPGVPHFGRTDSAAWAITASMVTTERLQEIVVIRRDGELIEEDSGEALLETRVRMPTRTNARRVRVIREFRGLPALPGDDDSEVHVSALVPGERATLTLVRSPVPEHPDRALHACRASLLAASAADVVGAFEGWAVPVNDLVAADADGVCLNTVVGAFADTADRPVDVPVHPVTELTVRANQRPSDPEASALRLGCAPPHRARRAEELLAEALADHGAITHEDLMRTQVDTRQAHWPPLVRQLLDDVTEPELLGVRCELLEWDGSMAADSPRAGVFARWRDALARHVAEDPALDTLRQSPNLPRLWAPFLELLPRVGLALESIIEHGPAVGVDPAQAAKRALREVAVQAAVAGGVSSDSVPAAWGDAHAFRPFRAHATLPAWKAVAVGGDTDCLLATGTIPGCGPGCVRVPAARVVWDLSDPAASLWITPDPIDRGELGSTPLQRWAAGHMDQALPWVPPGGLRSPYEVSPSAMAPSKIELGRLSVPTAPTARLRPVDPSDHCLIHEWVSARRARFWGMNGLSVEQVGAIYDFLAQSPTHCAWIVEINGEPAGIFQTYQPHADPTGATYRVQPGDLGAHVLLSPSSVTVAGLTPALGAALIRAAAAGGTRRMVVEPDVGNSKAIQRMLSVGFVLGPQIELPGKTGQLAFLNLMGEPAPESNPETGRPGRGTLL